MICSFCRKQLEDDETVCKGCGATIEKTSYIIAESMETPLNDSILESIPNKKFDIKK